MSYLVGIDIGTTNVKIACYDFEGHKIIGIVKKTKTHKEDNRITYNPSDIWKSVKGGLDEVCNRISDSGRIKGVSISSMGEAGVPLNRKKQCIYPIISWVDRRTIPQWQWWCKNVDQDQVYEITGMPFHSMYTINKIMWLRDNEPQIYQQMEKW